MPAAGAQALAPEPAAAPRSQSASTTRIFWYPYALIAPTMLTLTVVSLIPFLYTIYLSFHHMTYAQVGDFSGLANYRTLLTDGRFWHSVWIATVFILVAVPVEFALGLIGALILNQRIRLRSIIIPILFVPTMMAPIVVAILWKIMLAGSWGLLSFNILERFGVLREISVFASPGLALYALIFIDIWEWTPFMTLALFAGLQSLPVNPYRAAAVDGATPLQTFFRLTVPMMVSLMAVIGLLRFIDAFKIFDTIFILTAGGPGVATESVSLFAYKMVFDFWKLGPATATAVVIWAMFFIFCNIFYQVAQRKLKAF